MLAKYLTVSLPPIPTSVSKPPVKSWPMYGNDSLGDCTIASAAHLIQAWSLKAGNPKTPVEADVERAYWLTGTPSRTTGHPDGPTDVGRVELDVLNFWRHTGIGGDKIEAYVAIDPHNKAQMKAAIYLFGGVYLGVLLPKTAQTQARWTPSGTGPDSQPGSWGGHAVPAVGYTGQTLTVITWGAPLGMSWSFNARYTDEAYAIISKDWLTSAGKSPHGFDLPTLISDLAAL